jgi:hypothetical protein
MFVIKRLKRIFLPLLLLGAASSAQAIVITVDDDISGTHFLSNNDWVSGSYNIRSAITSAGDFNTLYTINSAYASFSFSDISNESTHTSTSTSGYYEYSATDDNGWTYMSRYTFDHTTDWDLDTSTAGVGTGNTWQTDYNSNEFHAPQHTYNGRVDNGNGEWYDSVDITNKTVYTTYSYETGYGYWGSYVIKINLSTASLTNIALNGELDMFAQAWGNSDVYFNNSSLTLDISKNPIYVSEPSSIILLSLGLIGLAYKRHKQT